MAWEMVRIAIEITKFEDSVMRHTMAGMCSALRAGLAVLETLPYIHDDTIKARELEAYVQVVKWFAGRWTVGKEYVERLESVVGL